MGLAPKPHNLRLKLNAAVGPVRKSPRVLNTLFQEVGLILAPDKSRGKLHNLHLFPTFTLGTFSRSHVTL